MCPNADFFLDRIFLYFDWIRGFTPYISVFSPNTGIYEPEKSPDLDIFSCSVGEPKVNQFLSYNKPKKDV